MTKTTTPTTPEAQTPEVAPKTPKAISFPPSGEPVRAVRAGTKLALLIDLLARPEGATLEQLSQALSATGSKVDALGVRAWLSYDLRRVGLGVVQPDDHLHLVGSPLPHLEERRQKVAAPIQNVEAAPMKKAAMTAARSRKAARAKK